MCCGNSADLYEEMIEWEKEQERMAKIAKMKKEAQTPMITVKATTRKE